MNSGSRRAYDHRIKEQIAETGDPGLFPELEIPRSTVRSWIRRGMGSVVCLEPNLGYPEHGPRSSAGSRRAAESGA